MGVWRSHHSVGNMVGSLVASAFVEYNWGLSFAVPSALIAILGLILFLFLASDPKTVGCPSPDNQVINIYFTSPYFFKFNITLLYVYAAGKGR